MSEKEKQLAHKMNKFWTSFAIDGYPHVDNEIIWPLYNTTTDQNIILSMSFEHYSGMKNILCNLWDSINIVPY